MGQVGESGEYKIRRVRVVCFYIRSFKGGCTRLCRLKTDRLAPMSKIEYVLAHTG
jgi:hypothetical protein